MSPVVTKARFDRDDAVRLAALVVIAIFGFVWWAALATQWDDEAALAHRDFYCFYRAGELLLAGEDPFSQDDHAFVNPPFTLPLAAALVPLGLRGSYIALAALGTVAWALGCVLAARFGEATDRRRTTIAIALLTTPCAFLALHLGQLSGVYFALLAGSLLAMTRGHDRAAGALATLLMAKPNFVIALAGAALLLGRRRLLATFALGTVVLMAISLPFGPDVWSDFWRALTRLAARHDTVASDYWKQLTIYAFFRATTHGLDPSGTLARGLWLLVALVFGAVIARVLWRHRDRFGEPAMAARLASIVVLATCALNAYLFYYDAIFLALPAATLVVAHRAWRRPALRRLAIACAALSWVLQIELTFIHESPPLHGIVTALWLAIELVDLSRST